MNITSNSTPKDIPRQRWLRIIPPILIACIISYMDRVNIAFAMPGGMDADLGISATMAGLAGGIFFIGYLFLQVPGGKLPFTAAVRNLSAGRWSPGRLSPC
jgi:sugar phosphate permease